MKQVILQLWHSVSGAWLLGCLGIGLIFIYIVNRKKDPTKVKSVFYKIALVLGFICWIVVILKFLRTVFGPRFFINI